MNKLTKYIVIVILLSLAIMPVSVNAKNEILIDTNPKDKADYYAWITFLSQGPTIWLNGKSSFEVQGRSYRIAILTSEIYNTIYIEEVTQGDEGCCVKVASIKKLDLDQFMKKFGLIGERAGVEFIRWVTATSLEIKFHDKKYLLYDIGKKQIKAKEIQINNAKTN